MNTQRQKGSALLMILAIVGIAAAYLVVNTLTASRQKLERDEVTARALAQAKDALIGWSATYRDKHTLLPFIPVPGYLPCPDTNNDGNTEPNCGAVDASEIGKLPWKTLGLPVLQDSAAECLWYVVSGRSKDNPTTAMLNWDTVGQLTLRDASGALLAAGGVHDSPVAVILAPRAVTGTQVRPLTAGECGGSNVATSYLEGSALLPGAGAISTLTLGNAASIAANTNNDAGLAITSKEIFDRIRMRSDFKTDVDTMLTDLETCLETAPPPPASASNKGIDNVIASCPASDAPSGRKAQFLANWRDNLLYARTGGSLTVGAETGCEAVLVFSGSRLPAQTRVTAADRLLPTNYLEGVNAASFPAGATYTGATTYDPANSSADVVRCIKSSSTPPASVSFASHFGNFVPSGAGVTPNAGAKTVNFDSAGGTGGGCFWYPNTISLAGKIIRAYYSFQFNQADPIGGSDRGNGFTLSLVRGDFMPPIPCGTQNDMGALDPASGWGVKSLIVETDVHLDASSNDPAENHTAIMAHGNLTHSLTNGNPTTACNGSAAGCRHSLANQFEESPTPLPHNQRLEIHTGCNSTCAACNPVAHAPPNNYSRISVWSDCSGASCSDVAADINRGAQPPTVNRCIQLDPELNTSYVGFTSGSRSGGVQQGVTIGGFDLRSQ